MYGCLARFRFLLQAAAELHFGYILAADPPQARSVTRTKIRVANRSFWRGAPALSLNPTKPTNFQATSLRNPHHNNVWSNLRRPLGYVFRIFTSTPSHTTKRTHPVQTNIQALSDTQFIFHLPSPPTINHIVVFLLPEGAALLPATHGATVHIKFPNRPFRLLGAISLQKPSAIFRVRPATTTTTTATNDEMTDGEDPDADAVLGISVEPLENVQAQLETLPAKTQMPSATVLARRIINDAFNYLSSFASPSVSGDVVPLKAFQDWWSKFERKMERDPTFLEREES
jgi:hypothetical protein